MTAASPGEERFRGHGGEALPATLAAPADGRRRRLHLGAQPFVSLAGRTAAEEHERRVRDTLDAPSTAGWRRWAARTSPELALN